MRVGILTFHAAHNYGAVLQCYALQEVLKKMGHEVYIIDYVDARTKGVYEPLSLYSIRRLPLHLRSVCHYLKSAPIRLRKKIIFERFAKNFLNITKKCNRYNLPQSINSYIIGSDQLWGINCLGGEEDPVYMGQFKHSANSNIFGYAISTNRMSLETIGANKLISYSNNFKYLSFREKSNATLMSDMTGKNVHVDIDPTLLTASSTWDPLINDYWKDKKYLLTYQARGSKDDIMRKKAKKIAEKYNLEYIDMTESISSVSDFVSAIKYAQCIITTSFHATAFSLIFNKPFWAVSLHDGHDARYVDLLSQLEGQDAIKDINFPIEMPELINYKKMTENLKRIQLDSIKYLENCFSN